MKKALVICWRRLMEACHQKKLLAFLILYPLLFMVIFGSVFGGENFVAFKMAIVTDSQDEITQAFINIFKEYKGIDAMVVKREGEMEEQAKNLIENKDCVAVMFLPKNFSKLVFFYTNVTIYYDASADINTQNIALGTINGIIEAFSRNVSEKKIKEMQQFANLTKEQMEYIKGIAQPINVITIGYSSTEKKLKYIDFLVPGLISMTIMWTGVSGVATSLVEDRITGIRRRILSAPVSSYEIIGGEILSNILIIGLQIVILLLVAVLLFKVTIVGSIWLLSLIIIIGMLLMTGIGLVISCLTKTAEEASQLSMLINFPMMFLSGIFFPMTTGWMFYVSRIFPLTYINEGLRGIMIKGSDFQEILSPFFISLSFAIAIFIIGVILMKRRGEE